MHTALLSFNSGEVSPYLRHRTDLDKAASSCETLRNFLALPYGGVVKRPGLVSLAGIEVDSEPVTVGENQTMFPFIASTGDRYLLHFMPDVLTIYRTDGTIADTVDFMEGYEWPEGPWEDAIRALHMVQINDVAFFTHPGSFPLRLKRTNDTEWHLVFIPFKRAPMLDENTDKNKTYTVASDPVADDWADGASYGVDDVVFTNCEWKCIKDHTASSGKKPGTGADWRDYWQRMFYEDGDPITLLADDREQVAWSPLWSYQAGAYVYPASDGTPYLDATVAYADSGADFIGEAIEDHEEPVAGTFSTDYWIKYAVWGGSYNNVGDRKYHHASGKIYECILAHAAATHEPSVAVDWATYWTEYATVTGLTQYRPQKYQAGTEVSRKGRQYACILDHYSRTERIPGSGTYWETYWVEISRMVEEWTAGNFSPGQYFRISPERDDQDFQLELLATGAVDDVKFSEYMAVHGAWNFNTFGTWWGTFKLQRSTNNGKTWHGIRSWQASGDRNIADSGIEDTPVLLRLKFIKEDGGTTESGLDNDDSPPRGLLIPESQYVTGYCLMDTYNSADEMTGFAKTAMLSGNTYRWAEGAFNSRDGFPRALTLHESRLCFASTAARPVSLWLSATDDLNNFETGTDADTAIYATLALSNSSPIRWLASQRRLFIGTAFGEWVAGSESSDAPLTPTNFLARQYSGYGSHPMQPMIALDATFFVERKGSRLRELAYFQDRQAYDASDLTRLGEHLLRVGVAAMAWQQTREPGLWVVTRDGGLLHFAYNRTERVMAWSRHDTSGGLFRDVVVLPSDEGDDEVFFLIDREAGTMIERFPQHWLAAIENEDTPVVTDTDEELPITAELASLPVDMSAQDGTTLARRKRLHKASLSLYHAAGGHVWNASEAAKQPIGDGTTITTGWVDVVPDSGHLDEVQFRLHHAAAQPFILRCATLRFVLHEK